MVAGEVSHAPLSSFLQPVDQPTEFRKTTSLSLKIGTPGFPRELSATEREGMTPSCSPAATPPTGPAPPGLEMGASGSVAPGGAVKDAHFESASKKHKKDKHIKELKGGMPPLNVHDVLKVKGGSEADTPERDEAADTPGRPVDGSDSDSDHSSAEVTSSDESVSTRPHKRGCAGLDAAPSSASEELLLPGVSTVTSSGLLATYSHPAELVQATTKDWEEVNWEEVEYELDADDDRWLGSHDGSGLTASQLEFLMDRLEKMQAGCGEDAAVNPEQIASLAKEPLTAEAATAAAGWWQEKRAARKEPLLRRLRPPTDFDDMDSSKVFRPGQRQRTIRERREAVNYREMSTGEINRLARQESAEQRKARIAADKARKEAFRERKRLLEEQQLAEAERLEEESRKRKREEDRALAAARKVQFVAERVGSVLERIVRTIVKDDRERRRLERAERDRIATELRHQKQLAVQRRRDRAEISKVVQSMIMTLEAADARNAKQNARAQARLRREQASAKLAELASSRLKDNSVAKVVRQARGPVRAIAYDPVECAVIAACADNSLWRGRLDATAASEAAPPSWESAAVEWTRVGTALHVVAQAVLGDHLFACDRSNTIWRCNLRVELGVVGIVWEFWGKLGTKQNGVMALTAADGHLYAATNAGKLMATDASAPHGKWSEVGVADKVRAMASVPGLEHQVVQFALSADGAFWRREGERGSWERLGTPDTKPVAANGIAATESVVVGSDSTSVLCCSVTDRAGGRETEREASHWWRCVPLPPVQFGKKTAAPQGRQTEAETTAQTRTQTQTQKQAGTSTSATSAASAPAETETRTEAEAETQQEAETETTQADAEKAPADTAPE